MRVLFGIDTIREGELYIREKKVPVSSTKDAIAKRTRDGSGG